MHAAEILTRIAAELALFAGAGFLLLGLNDVAVDAIYFARRFWRSRTVYKRYRRAYASYYCFNKSPGFIAVFVPAWDESTVIAQMLGFALKRLDYPDYRIFVGHYRNDPATAAAIATLTDERIIAVEVETDGPTTKADCLNYLYDALVAHEMDCGRRAKAIVLHDAEDVVHRYELRIFDGLIDRAAVVQLPVLPLVDHNSRWISGHYCDEFAEAHIKELVVREAVGAAIPLAGVGCAIAREPLARLASANEGRPFAGTSLTEDYEIGLLIGDLGLRTMFVRIPSEPGEPGVVASRGYFPATLGAAVRQKARWLGGIAFAGWDRLGWSGGVGERWMRLRDRRGPFAALLIVCAYIAAIIWSQLWLARLLGSPIQIRIEPLLATLLTINALLLGWRVLMRAFFTASAYGWYEGLLSIPRLFVGNLIAVLAAFRAFFRYRNGRTPRWDKTQHLFPKELAL
jgi:adsorption protein B